MKLSRGTGWLIAVSITAITGLISACAPALPMAKQPDKAPVIENINYTKDIMAGSEMQIECYAKDADGDSLQYEWSTDNGNIIGTGAKMLWISPDTMGNYDLAVRAYDGRGGEAKQTISIRVLTNADGTTAPPITLKMSLASSEIVSENRTTKVGTTTKIICEVDNTAGKKLSYEWSASGGKFKGKGLDEITCSVVFWTAPPLTQIYTVTVVVKDEQGSTAQGQVLFDVFCCPRN